MTAGPQFTPEQVEIAKSAWSKRNRDCVFILCMLLLPWPLWFYPATAEWLNEGPRKNLAVMIFAVYGFALIFWARHISKCPQCGAQLADAVNPRYCPRCAVPLR
jgi:hypothetical protein